jgi:hypothetical protein
MYSPTIFSGISNTGHFSLLTPHTSAFSSGTPMRVTSIFSCYVDSFCGLFFFVLCILCCQYLWIVFLRLMYPMLPVSLDFFSSSCVPYVASFSGLFFFVLCILCCQFLWIVFLRLVYPMLPVSVGCFSSSCVSYVASLYRETGNRENTRRRKTIHRNWQHRIHKTKKNNPQKLAT